MEEGFEFVIRKLAWLLYQTARALLWVVEYLYELPCWWIGWCVWRGLSLGRWPQEGFTEQDRAGPWTAAVVGLTGLVTLVSICVLLGHWLRA